MGGDELEFVEWLRRRTTESKDSLSSTRYPPPLPRGDQGGTTAPTVRLGIGDDMAIVDLAPGSMLISSDMLLEGVHFDTDRHELRDIGRKAVACSLSDCAAMAVRPVAATVSVALPATLPLCDAQALYEGILVIADEYELAIAGGDTTRWPKPLAIDVAIVATPLPGISPVTRSGAKVGDTLYLTGPVGGSSLGRHLSFTPRVREAHALAEHLADDLHAMLDVSDGVSLDLWRMCESSGVGAVLDESLLSAAISDDALQASQRDGRTPIEHALTDGEDFELLLAVADRTVGTSVTLLPIGRITESGFAMRYADGQVNPIEPRGYVH